MVLKWFDANDAHKFGELLADYFIQKIPLATGNNKNDATILHKQFKTLDEIYLKVDQFKLNNSLNFYKKAKLGAAFKDKLITAGYDPKLVDILTKGLMIKL